MSILGETRQANDTCVSFVGAKPERWSKATREDRNSRGLCNDYSGVYPCRNHLKTLLEIGDII